MAQSMNEKKSFTPRVADKLGHYVYCLIDPRTKKTFYVGKGQGDRMFNHANGVLKDAEKNPLLEKPLSLKMDTIKAIKKAGREVEYIIHRHQIPKDAIYHVEAAVIDAYLDLSDGLSNINKGYKSNKFGPLTVDKVEQEYGLKEMTIRPNDKLLLIKVPQLKDNYSEKDLREKVQYAWQIDKNKVKKVDYIIAVKNNVALGVFTTKDGWKRVTKEDYPEADEKTLKRHTFDAVWADDEVVTHYCGPRGNNKLPLGKRLSEEHTRKPGAQNPLGYINI
jgi:hypothetical protein